MFRPREGRAADKVAIFTDRQYCRVDPILREATGDQRCQLTAPGESDEGDPTWLDICLHKLANPRFHGGYVVVVIRILRTLWRDEIEPAIFKYRLLDTRKIVLPELW
jgi:hypothetical protein